MNWVFQEFQPIGLLTDACEVDSLAWIHDLNRVTVTWDHYLQVFIYGHQYIYQTEINTADPVKSQIILMKVWVFLTLELCFLLLICQPLVWVAVQVLDVIMGFSHLSKHIHLVYAQLYWHERAGFRSLVHALPAIHMGGNAPWAHWHF